MKYVARKRLRLTQLNVFWTGSISFEMAKTEFCNIKGILSGKLDVIKQRFGF